LAARPMSAGGETAAGAAFDPTALVELRALVTELQAAQERRFDELRAETQRAATLAEEALASVRAAAAATPAGNFVTDLAAMASSVERLHGEQASFRSALDAVTNDANGADEECERRLRQA